MRGIVVLGVGSLLTLAGAPQIRAQTKQAEATANQTQAAPSVASNTEAVEPIQPSEYYKPCRQDNRNYRSDLCAQWTAAQGAIDAAYWAKWGFWLSLAGLLGLVGTLFYTRKAVLAAEEGTRDADAAIKIAGKNASAAMRAARAAGEANSIAQETAHRQLRPYVYLTECHVTYDHMAGFNYVGDRGVLILYFKNFGQTPAKDATLRAQASIGGHFNEPFPSDFSEATEVQLGDLPPDYVKDRDGYYVLGLKAAHENIIFGTMTVFVEGVVRYRDSNGERYETVFRLGATAEDYTNNKWSVPPHGNRAT